MNVRRLYPNIPHDELLSVLRKRFKSRKEKYILSDTIVAFAEIVLKNNIFTVWQTKLKQKRETAIGIKLAPPCSILFTAEMEEKIIKESEYKPYL